MLRGWLDSSIGNMGSLSKEMNLISLGVSSPQLAARFVLCGWYFDTLLLAAGNFIRLCKIILKIIDNKGIMKSIAIDNYQIARDLFIPEKVNKTILKFFEESLN